MTTKKGACAPFLLQPRQEYACRRGPHEMGFLPKRPLANMLMHVANVTQSERLSSKLDAL